jgi:hypothetical protein
LVYVASGREALARRLEVKAQDALPTLERLVLGIAISAVAWLPPDRGLPG